MDVDADAPPPKRRGSTVATQSIANLTLNDRRHSIDVGRWSTFRGDRRAGEPNAGPGAGPSSANAGGPPSSLETFAWPKSDSNSAMHQTQHHQHQPAGIPPNFPTDHHMMPQLSMADRRMSMPESTTARILRSRSRPPSRSTGQVEQQSASTSSGQEEVVTATSPTLKAAREAGGTPYSRSPELRVSHKLAERKRRKEMKDLFDELRDQLPADRGMKASKWEILSKGAHKSAISMRSSLANCRRVHAFPAIDFVGQLKQSNQDMAREIEMLRHELDVMRGGGQSMAYPPGAHVVYHAPPPPTAAPAPAYTAPPPHHPASQPASRPASSQNHHHPFPTQPGAVMSMNGSARGAPAEGQQAS
jgi:hypothetical protein